MSQSFTLENTCSGLPQEPIYSSEQTFHDIFNYNENLYFLSRDFRYDFTCSSQPAIKIYAALLVRDEKLYAKNIILIIQHW